MICDENQKAYGLDARAQEGAILWNLAIAETAYRKLYLQDTNTKGSRINVLLLRGQFP
jgi:hypothetical protein